MNNLFVVVIAGGVGLTLFLKTQSKIAETELSNARSQYLAKAAIKQNAETRAELARLDRLYISEQKSIQRLRTEANERTKRAAQEPDLNDLTPQKEGFWPKDQPYFYISKSRLQGLGYWPLTDDNYRFSETAARLFGMSPEEEKAANAVYERLIDQIHESEVSHAIPTNTPAWIEGWPGTKKSFYIESLPIEESQKIEKEFKAALQNAIGEERGTLLARKIDETFDSSAFRLMRSRTLTLVRDGDKIQLCTSGDFGGTTTSHSTAGNGRDEIPRYVRHLFSEE